MANKIYRISIQAAPRLRLATGASIFFTTTLTAEEGSTFRAMKYNPGVIVECTEPNGRKTYSFHDQFVRTPQVDSLEELMNELETHLLVPGETFEIKYTDHWGDEVTIPIEVICGEVFKINGKWLRGIMALRGEINTITSGMYPTYWLRYQSGFTIKYPEAIISYMDFPQSGRAPSGDFADPTANISIELLDQL